jgi:hypothetical protein
MDLSVSPKDEIWFLHVCHHISNAVYIRFFTSTKHSDWFRDQPSLTFNWYQEFFVWWNSGCSIRNLTNHLHLQLPSTITVLKLFLPVRAIVTKIRKIHLYIYWLCACKSTQHSSLCKGKTKNQGSFHDPTTCNFVRQMKGVSSEASRCQSNNRIFCIHMYFVLPSLVTTVTSSHKCIK